MIEATLDERFLDADECLRLGGCADKAEDGSYLGIGSERGNDVCSE